MERTAARGHVEVTLVLVRAGAKVNLQDVTPASVAAYCGRVEALAVLISAGADIAIPLRKDTGKCCVHRAAAAEQTGCLTLLYEAGADLELETSRGESVLNTEYSDKVSAWVRVVKSGW